MYVHERHVIEKNVIYTLYVNKKGNGIYIPEQLRYRIFKMHHNNLAHSNMQKTLSMIKEKYFWPTMKKDIKKMAQSCDRCQKSKIWRHNISALKPFPIPNARFEDLNIDILGPLRLSKGFRYILSVMDRYTRWYEPIPMKNINAETVVEAFLHGWVARFGAPKVIITDRGGQFISEKWKLCMAYLGTQHNFTHAYSPSENGLVERQHRTLKNSLRAKCTNADEWYERLPFIMLGLRNSNFTNHEISPSEMLLGHKVRLPGALIVEEEKSTNADPQFVTNFIWHMSNLPPIPFENKERKAYIQKEFKNCTHCYVREDRVKPSLAPCYKGPFFNVKRTDQ